jgi:hypothetical protein
VAQLRPEGNELVLHLHALEKAEGFHSDIRVPLSAVTGVPDVIAVGTRRGSFGKDFAAVHGTGPAVVVELGGADFARLVVTSDDAPATAEAIREAAGDG